MATGSYLPVDRRSSQEIIPASEATISTTRLNDQHDRLLNINNTESSPLPSTLHPQQASKTTDLPKHKTSKKGRQLKTKPSEVELTVFQKYLSWRYAIGTLLCTSYVLTMFYFSLPMAMVCMVRSRTAPTAPFSNRSQILSNRINNDINSATVEFQTLNNYSFYGNNTGGQDTDYEFDWSPEIQGLVLSATMITSCVSPILMGLIKDFIGTKQTLFVGNLVSSLLTFLTPTAARISPYGLLVVRVLLGVSMTANIPVIGDCISWWTPKDERLTMISITYAGFNIGGILANVLSGYLCLIPLDNGWPFVFYTFGTVALIWGACWYFLSARKPEDHPYISEREKQYIISHRAGMNNQAGVSKVKTPYRKLLTSVPVLAMLAVGSCQLWTTFGINSYLPRFFNKQLKFSVDVTGLLVSLTSVFRLVGTLFWISVGNKLMSAFGTSRSRKICICVGFFSAGAAMMTVGFFDENHKWVVIVVIIFVMLNQSIGTTAIPALCLDMAPRFGGILISMYTAVGYFASVSCPLLISQILTNGTKEEWRTVMILLGSVFIAGAAIFLLFGQASIQPWALVDAKDPPHIITPLVSLGLLDTQPPPVVVPLNTKVHMLPTYHIPATNSLSQLIFATEEVLSSRNSEPGKIPERQDTVASSEKLEEGSRKEEEHESNEGYEISDNVEEQTIPYKQEVFS